MRNWRNRIDIALFEHFLISFFALMHAGFFSHMDLLSLNLFDLCGSLVGFIARLAL